MNPLIVRSVIMVLIGLPFCAIFYVLQRGAMNKWLRCLYLVLALICLALVSYFFQARIAMGEESWWQQTPWKQFIMFALMGAGMFSSVLNAAIRQRSVELQKLRKSGKNPKVKLSIDRWELVQPFLFSLITFAALHSQVGEGALNTANVALSFETGFLWQVLTSRQLRGAS